MKGSTKTTTALPRVAVVVMGDLGRSRRMLAHARCLAEAGWAVDLIGFRQTDLPSFIDSRIRVRSLPSFDSVRARRPAAMFFIFAIARQFLLSLALARILLSRFDVVLVQIPPSFPALPLILLAAKLRKSLLVIDWHNTTAAMLRLRVSDGGGLSARIVRFCGDLEIRVARGADAHFCATAALTGFIGERGLSGQELPDAIDFQARDAASPEPFTIVSPSSWSSDDDFELFFNALPLLDSLLAPTNLRLRFLFSGVGELREWFESRCATLSLNRVRVETTFVPPDDYPGLLRKGILGMSLHRSAEGLDLPLKIVEMLSVGTPVCALDSGPATRSRIRENETGILFSTSDELARKVVALLDPGNPILERMRDHLARERPESWATGWNRVARPLFEQATSPVEKPEPHPDRP